MKLNIINKKITAFVFAALMIASVFAGFVTPVMAIGTPVEINIESVDVNPNDIFTINITLSNTPTAGVGAYGFDLIFDPTVVQVKGVTNMPGIGVPSWDNEAGTIRI
ncbi:MAG: hypothetical protein HF967_09165, partial [Methanosarcinales archaeon]|nr:hypothetical protein [Methanosarcinales archaeon]